MRTVARGPNSFGTVGHTMDDIVPSLAILWEVRLIVPIVAQVGSVDGTVAHGAHIVLVVWPTSSKYARTRSNLGFETAKTTANKRIQYSMDTVNSQLPSYGYHCYCTLVSLISSSNTDGGFNLIFIHIASALNKTGSPGNPPVLHTSLSASCFFCVAYAILS